MGRKFVKAFGGPDNEQILVLPLALKDKVAALLYADGGTGMLDLDALELLVHRDQRMAGSNFIAQAGAVEK